MALNDIKKQMHSISKTAQITNAMQLISTTKYNRISDHAKNYQIYSEQIRQAVIRLVQSVSDIHLLSTESFLEADMIQSHDLLIQRPIQKKAILVITSSQGLAGNYNSSIIKTLEQTLANSHPDDIHIIGIGHPAIQFAKKNGYSLLLEREQVSSYPDFVEVQLFIRQIVKMFREGVFDELDILYNHAVNVMQIDTLQELLLPLDPKQLIPHDETMVPQSEYLVEPDWQTVLDRLLPLYVESQIYGAIIAAKSAEYSSRMQAMRQATDNANELIEDLNQEYHHERQKRITNEIIEIINGANAQG
ncbi:ATP synthase F1 subunit gamma [Aerococcaceae bacterium DSM 111020]|nr:ATP synthase F1 subunit gamma [Aerococcaceae bacterium DSM 111020]